MVPKHTLNDCQHLLNALTLLLCPQMWSVFCMSWRWVFILMSWNSLCQSDHITLLHHSSFIPHWLTEYLLSYWDTSIKISSNDEGLFTWNTSSFYFMHLEILSLWKNAYILLLNWPWHPYKAIFLPIDILCDNITTSTSFWS